MDDGAEDGVEDSGTKWYKTSSNNLHSHTWSPASKFTSIDARHKHEVYVDKMETDTSTIKVFGLFTVSHKHKLTMTEK